MKAAAIIFLLIFTAADTPVSETVVCDTVRYYVGLYGEAAAFIWAKAHGWSKERIAEARKCLVR